MSIIFFSSSRRSFFDVRFKDDFDVVGTWPEDATEITQRQYLIYSTTPPEGKMPGADKTRSPSWLDKPDPSDDELKALVLQKKSALMAVAETAIAPQSRAVKLGLATEKRLRS